MKFFERLFGKTVTHRPQLLPEGAERKRRELARDIALAGVHDEHPVWLAVLSLVDEHAARETDAALAPKLTNEDRQYTAGCAATATYLTQYLRDARTLATQRMDRERKREE